MCSFFFSSSTFMIYNFLVLPELKNSGDSWLYVDCFVLRADSAGLAESRALV